MRNELQITIIAKRPDYVPCLRKYAKTRKVPCSAEFVGLVWRELESFAFKEQALLQDISCLLTDRSLISQWLSFGNTVMSIIFLSVFFVCKTKCGNVDHILKLFNLWKSKYRNVNHISIFLLLHKGWNIIMLIIFQNVFNR